MTDESPDWEAATRESVPSVIDQRSMDVREKAWDITDRLRGGKTVRQEDIDALATRLDEFEYYIERVLEPIAVDEQSETGESRDSHAD